MDTCGASGSVALAEDERLLGVESLPGRSASERLVPAVRSLLGAQGWESKTLAAIGVVHGPGSFTGVRVGLSAAKGLSDASGVGLVAVSRLAVLAARAGIGRVHAVLDAGRGEFYHGLYGEGRRVSESLLTLEELRAAVGQETVVLCEEKVAASLEGMVQRVVEEPTAAAAIPLVRARVLAGEFDDPVTLDANYLRRSDSQLFARMAGAVGG